MNNLTTYADQSVFDIALQAYGSVEGVFDILKANAGLQLDSHIAPGTILQLPGDVVKQEIVDYYKKNNIKPATGALPSLPEFINNDMLKQILNYDLADGDHVFAGLKLINLNLNATVQLNYSNINSADVQVSLEMSLNGLDFDPVPGSAQTLDNTKDSHSWIIIGLITNYIRLKVIVNTATAGMLDELLVRL